MRLLVQSVRIGLLVNLSYRSQLLFWTAVRALYFAMTYALWAAIFAARSGAEIRGYGLEEMVVYYLLIYVVSSIAAANYEWMMRSDIATGELAPMLAKPQHYLLRIMADGVSGTWLYGLLGVCVYGAIALALDVDVAALVRTDQLPAAVLATLLALAIASCLAGMLGCVTFWVPESGPILGMKGVVLPVLTGAVVPLDVLPALAQRILGLTPFPWMGYFPVRLLTQPVPGGELLAGLGAQCLWVLVLSFALRHVWRSGLRRFEAVGG